jgi:hypothetical protein
MRKMEREAYTKGNLIFRDYEDLIKTGKIEVHIDFTESGEPKMSLKEWKNNEINTKLMQKWGLLKEAKEVTTEDTEELEEGHEHGPECGCPDMEEGMKYRADEDKLEEDTEGEETYDYGEAEGHDEKELHDLIKRHATKSHIDALKRDMDYDEDHERRGEEGTDFREGAGDAKITKLPDGTHHYEGPFVGAEDDGEAPLAVDATVSIAPGDPDRPQAGWDGKTPRGHRAPPTPEYAGTSIGARKGSRSSKHVRGAPRQENQKISVREAKQITRRIIERIRKEGK